MKKLIVFFALCVTCNLVNAVASAKISKRNWFAGLDAGLVCKVCLVAVAPDDLVDLATKKSPKILCQYSNFRAKNAAYFCKLAKKLEPCVELCLEEKAVDVKKLNKIWTEKCSGVAAENATRTESDADKCLKASCEEIDDVCNKNCGTYELSMTKIIDMLFAKDPQKLKETFARMCEYSNCYGNCASVQLFEKCGINETEIKIDLDATMTTWASNLFMGQLPDSCKNLTLSGVVKTRQTTSATISAFEAATSISILTSTPIQKTGSAGQNLQNVDPNKPTSSVSAKTPLTLLELTAMFVLLQNCFKI